METYKMTTDQIFEDIKNGNAQVAEIAVCRKLINTGSDPYFIRIEGNKILGMTPNGIDKVTLVKDTPDAEIMKLAVRIKESVDYLNECYGC